jgi:signal transduction histidine kinase/CheY-like chemotaxis protein
MKDAIVHILLIEPDEAFATAVRRAIANRGARRCLTIARSLEEARERMAEATPNLILAELRLPDGSALELLPEDGSEPAFPLVLLVGPADEREALRALKAGIADFIVKPEAALDELPRVMGKALARWDHRLARQRVVGALRQSEELLHQTFNATPDLLLALDAEFNVVWCNWRGYDYIPLEERVGQPKCYTVFKRRDRPCENCFAVEVFETKKPHHSERYNSLDDKLREVNVYPIFDDAGEVVMVTQHLRDVTEKRRVEEEQERLEAQVQYAQKMESLGIMAGGIAHDFNNLLVGVLGNADLVLEQLPSASPLSSNVIQIKQAARCAADLCLQMLAYSGKGKFVVERIDLSDLIEQMAHLLEVCVSTNVEISYNLSEESPTIEGDATQIRQVVTNLIANASEAIGLPKGKIELATGVMDCDRAYLKQVFINDNLPEGRYAFLEVKDTGCGMEREGLRKIFDPFFSTKFTGRGLGLAAVLGVVRGHLGAIKIDTAPKQGSRFRILFPAVAIEPLPAAAEKELAHSSSNFKGGIVLLVDDDELVREVGLQMLEQAGYTAVAAEGGREAVRTLREDREWTRAQGGLLSGGGSNLGIECVLLDVTMPQMDGAETFIELRKIDGNLPIILSSGYSEKEIRERFAGKEVTGFMQKPYQLSQLRTALAAVFQG